MSEQDWQLSIKNQTWNVAMSQEIVTSYIRDLTKYGMLRKPLNAADFTSLAMLEKAKVAVGW
jgi:hypothetical protein